MVAAKNSNWHLNRQSMVAAKNSNWHLNRQSTKNSQLEAPWRIPKGQTAQERRLLRIEKLPSGMTSTCPYLYLFIAARSSDFAQL
jgi:hypothetical protein